MPDRIFSDEEKAAIKRRMLKLLSVDGRRSIRDLASKLNVPQTTLNRLFRETVKEQDIRFTPEIGIEELWRWEFVKYARTYNKKGILENVIEKLPELGFEEYLIFIKFIDGIPTDIEFSKALEKHYIPQFAARLHGEYDVVIYGIARSYDEINRFLNTFREDISSLDKHYEIRSELLNIRTTFGFFPMQNNLVEKFQILDTYKHILLALNEDGRKEFSAIAKESKHGLPHIIYAYERLIDTGMLRRITYYENKPNNVVTLIVQVTILNDKQFLNSRSVWWLDMVRDYDKHIEYTFMCDISTPQGIIIFMNFVDGNSAEKFLNKLRTELHGSSIKPFFMTQILLGNTGVRDFDAVYSRQYKFLESAKLIPKSYKK
ncbi:MAG: winged helix-turn-helix transcriptional regulator [Candidatus Micrarchaeales archaeon]